MSGAVIFVLAIAAMMGFFGFAEFVAPIPKAAILWVPAIFTMSLAVGFASRRQRWFQ
jgi:hypothetical protein